MQRLLIYAGIALVLLGLAWPWASRLPLGHLPGDIVIDRPGMKVYLPIATCIVVSAVISIVAWLLRR